VILTRYSTAHLTMTSTNNFPIDWFIYIIVLGGYYEIAVSRNILIHIHTHILFGIRVHSQIRIHIHSRINIHIRFPIRSHILIHIRIQFIFLFVLISCA